MSNPMNTLGLSEYEGAVQQKIRLHWGEGSMNLEKRMEEPLFRALYIVACEQEKELKSPRITLCREDLEILVDALDATFEDREGWRTKIARAVRLMNSFV